MTSWTRVTLKEVTEISKGLSYQGKFLTDHGLPLVNLKCIKAGGGLRPDATKPYSGPFKEQHVVLPGDLVIANTDLTQSGGVIGSPALVPLLSGHEHGIISHHLCRVRALPGAEINQRFLYYRLLSPDFKAFARSVASGTTVLGLRTSDIERFEFQIPESNVQERIGRALGGFDDLIENNRRRIELLEETARLLYREWFVHFRYPGHEDVPLVESELGLIPEGWEVGVLGDVADEIRNSVKPSPETQLMPYVPIDAISPKQITLGKKRPGTEAKSSLRHFKTGDVLFGAMRAYFHKVAQAPFEGLTRSTCFVLRPHLGRYYFTLMKLADETTVAFAAANSTGSTIPYAHWDGVLSQMETVIPPEEVAGDFGEIIRPLLEICQALTQQGEILRETRDLLLPRLVSGDLDISDLDLNLEAVG